jgi:hypothetical protein
VIVVEESEKRIVLRFSARRVGERRKLVEVVHFYSLTGGKVFYARCERGVISSFLERINGVARRSRTGKTIYLEGARAEELFRKLIILTGCRQCTRSPSKIPEIAEVVAGLGEFETIFWYSKMLVEYEKKGFWGVCRVAKAFRVLHRID